MDKCTVSTELKDCGLKDSCKESIVPLPNNAPVFRASEPAHQQTLSKIEKPPSSELT